MSEETRMEFGSKQVEKVMKSEYRTKGNILRNALLKTKEDVLILSGYGLDSILRDCNLRIENELKELELVLDDIEKKISSLFEIGEMDIESGRGVNEWLAYQHSVVKADSIESRVLELVNVIPKFIQLYHFQTTAERFSHYLHILNALTREITEFLGEGRRALAVFSEAFTFKTILENYSIVSVPLALSNHIGGWIPVGHELGHWLWASSGTMGIDFQKYLESNLDIELNSVDLDWIQEIFSDIIMAEMFSTASHSMLFRHSKFLSSFREGGSHPPDILRLLMVGKWLVKRIDDPEFPKQIAETDDRMLSSKIEQEMWNPWLNDEFLEMIIDYCLKKVEELNLYHGGNDYFETLQVISTKGDLTNYPLRSIVGALSNVNQNTPDFDYAYQELEHRVGRTK